MARDLERAILAHLTPGDDGARFALRAGAAAALGQALARDLAGPTAQDDVQVALRLAAAMDGALRSPGVAAEIRAALRARPEAVAAIRARRARNAPGAGLDATRRFARREGRAAVVRAPMHDQPAPVGSVPLRAFLEPARDLKGRASPTHDAR
jgi:hypothetical protein